MTAGRRNLGPTITMAHGGGGKAMHDLIDEVFVRRFGATGGREDQARLPLADMLARGDRLAFTTDSYVVDPLFFPGGDIGSLAVNGTINDLAMGGAIPLALSCAVIVEEGLPIDVLDRVAESMRRAADAAGVKIVTGDTKVVNRGAADKLFVNTAGIGVIGSGIDIRADRACPGDAVLVSGFIGDHGATILNARGELGLDAAIASDTQPLHELVQAMLEACADIHCLRDATRGGLASVLNEFARASQVRIVVDETQLPVREEVRGVCAILGLDPLYFANEGKLVAVVPETAARSVLEAMRTHPAGVDSTILGEVHASPTAVVTLRSRFGGERIVDMPIGEQLPRIC
ncbi:MAG: hydrogenase expression/formation protein HypE [Caldimonas sp.]